MVSIFINKAFVKNSFYLFVYCLWLCWVFVAVCGLSPDALSGAYSLVTMCQLLTKAACLVGSKSSSVHGLQQLQLEGSRAQAQQLWSTGLVASWHVESSWTRDRTNVPCIGRQTLNQWIT